MARGRRAAAVAQREHLLLVAIRPEEHLVDRGMEPFQIAVDVLHRLCAILSEERNVRSSRGELDRHFAEVGERGANRVMSLGGSGKQEEAASARTENLASAGAGGECALVPHIDLWRANAPGERSLQLPVLVQ